eukprot:scaffold185160_cov19-Tisochrysis_lutea.AAC.2
MTGAAPSAALLPRGYNSLRAGQGQASTMLRNGMGATNQSKPNQSIVLGCNLEKKRPDATWLQMEWRASEQAGWERASGMLGNGKHAP